MKTLIILKNRHLLCLLLIVSHGITLYAQNCSDSQVDFSNEIKLDVNRPPYEIDDDKISKNIALLKCRIRYKGGSSPAPFAIKSSDVVSMLYSEAESDRRQRCAKGECITGIWILFGATRNGIHYLFQPAVYRLKDSTKLLRVFTEVIHGKIYSQDLTLGPLSPEKIDEYKKLYYNNIRIRHRLLSLKKSGKFKKADPCQETWRGDTRMIFYSFQEILGFYSKNNTQENSPGNYYCNDIYINSSAGKFNKNMKLKRTFGRVKHSTFITVMSGIEKRVSLKAQSESANGTDLAHLCPSNCNSVSYPTISRLKELNKTY